MREEVQENTKLSTGVGVDENLKIIKEVFNATNDKYEALGYFPQIYEASLQATYYGLYILNAFEKLSEIDESEILQFIESLYDDANGYYVDTYANRYMDTDFSQVYYPFSTLLEVNCYAVFSLDILNQISEGEADDFEDFIWSCYNPVTSGFIGRPYSSGLDSNFKISTMDNTFYAIITLDMLMDGNWGDYSDEKADLVDYIKGLQSLFVYTPAEWYQGGFCNDYDENFDSLIMFEPNFLASYYCVKSLEVFDIADGINVNDFHGYLGGLYDSDSNRFIGGNYFDTSFMNIVANAIGLELASITQFTSIDSDSVISFILDNRNSLGMWDSSVDYSIHELIDTFQIIRPFVDLNMLSEFNETIVNKTIQGISSFFHHNGFSLLSEDYTSMKLIHNVVTSFNWYGRIMDLDQETIYSTIVNCYKDGGIFNFHTFRAVSNLDNNYPWLRSYPIEYYSSGDSHNFTATTQMLYSHKSTYMALDAFKNLYKLDDFGLIYDLNELLLDINSSQFLDSEYDNYGGFLPDVSFTQSPSSEYKNKKIYFEYTYYAIKSLEILNEELETFENITQVRFDLDALTYYITRNIIEDASWIFFDPRHSDDTEIILENTYYAIATLKAVSKYDLNDEKIRNMVIDNLDYSNFKNIYYSFKISELLGLEVVFDVSAIQNLVQTVYSEELNEFYLTTDKQTVNQDIFLWICEMSLDTTLRLTPIFRNGYFESETVMLGGYNTVGLKFCNLIFSNPIPTRYEVKFESNQTGTHILENKPDNTFEKKIFVPVDPKSYPVVSGNICIYNNSALITKFSASFETSYSLNSYTYKESRGNNSIHISVNCSIKTGLGDLPLRDGNIYADIYNGTENIETKHFELHHFEDHTLFTLNFSTENKSFKEKKCNLKVYLADGYESDIIELNSTFVSANSDSGGNTIVDPIDDDDGDDFENNNSTIFDNNIEMGGLVPIVAALIAVPGVVVVGSKKLSNGKKPRINKAKK